MKMKKMLIMALVCSLTLLGCKNEKSNQETAGGEQLSGNLITKDPREATIFAIFQGKAIDGELPVFKKAFEETNIKLVSDFENLGMEGGLIPLEDLIDKYAPNLKKFFEENPRYKKDAIAADGHIYIIPNYNDYFNLKTTQGYYIRKDWLKKLNLKEPKTVDELYKTLVAFRDKDPNGNGKKDEVPLFLRGNITRKIMMGLADIFKVSVVWYDDKGMPKYRSIYKRYGFKRLYAFK